MNGYQPFQLLCPLVYVESKTIILTDAPGFLGEHSKRTEKPRRVNRASEREDYHVLRAVPEGSARVSITSVWLARVTDWLDETHRRDDFRRNVMALACKLMAECDFETKTVTPGRWALAEALAVHRHTIPRYLRALRHAGLLGLVAPGRQARYCPESSEEHTRYPRAGVERHGDRSVYVLCAPLSEEELAERASEELGRMENKCRINTFMDRFKLAVDVTATPLPSTAKLNPRRIYEWASPTLQSHFEAAAKYVARQDAARTDLSWPRNATTSAQNEATTRANELQAARSLQWDVPTLASMRSTTLASILKPYFRCGWTVADIKHALDHKPDGSRHAHDGFKGMSVLAIAVKHRLGYWKHAGQPVYSRSQRVMRNSEEARARALAVAQRGPTPPADEAARGKFSQGVQMLRAALRLGTQTPC